MAGLVAAKRSRAGLGAPLAKSWPKTPHDGLALPDGRKLGAVPSAELAALLVRLEIPGASPSAGRAALADTYATHLAGIGSAAADAAVTAWLGERAAA